MDRYVDTNGIKVHLIDHEGDGPALVLAPGLTSNCHSFDGLVAHGLAPAMRVLAFDLRGRGESDKPDDGYDLDHHAADVIGVLDELGIDEVFMGGHSYGGMLSFWTAVHHAQRVAGVIALDPPATLSELVREQIQPAVDRLNLVVPSFETYLETVKAFPFYEGWWDPMIEGFYHADIEDVEGGVSPRSSSAHIDLVLDGCMKVDWGATHDAVTQPTLVIRATGPYGPPGYPAILSREEADLILEKLHDGRLVEIDANHMTMLFGDAADQTASAILEFVDSA